ncbi:MAG: DUF1566 domain-containing protein [Deltaproteobacteria bacterium]|nr:DUF1566 domain-containing protein [Deltaproteobacteria bacterium]
MAFFMLGGLFCSSSLPAYAGELPTSVPPCSQSSPDGRWVDHGNGTMTTADTGELPTSVPPCDGSSPDGRWVDNGNGTVTDTTTQLVWLQDAGWGGPKNWSTAASRAAEVQNGIPFSLTDGSQAGQWRLPTKDELVALTTGTEAIRSSSMYLFTGIQSSYYWSSTTFAYFPGYAWAVDMTDGYVGYVNETNIAFIWPVRGGQ